MTAEPADVRTGATDAQIEAALKKEMEWRTERKDIPFLYSRQCAPFLVPPGFVIAAAADVLSPAVREAIGRVAVYLEARKRWMELDDEDGDLLVAMSEANQDITDVHRAALARIAEGSGSG